MTYHAAYQPQRAVRTERWKYIRRFHDYPHPVLANCDDSASKQLLVDNGWGEQFVPEEQLYDLVFDPSEEATSPSARSTRRRSRSFAASCSSWMRETEDPLLDGPVPLPPGAWANDPAQASPNDPWRTETETPDGTAVR